MPHDKLHMTHYTRAMGNTNDGQPTQAGTYHGGSSCAANRILGANLASVPVGPIGEAEPLPYNKTHGREKDEGKGEDEDESVIAQLGAEERRFRRRSMGDRSISATRTISNLNKTK